MPNNNETFFSRFARDPLNADAINVNLNYTASTDYIIEVPPKIAEVKATGTVTLIDDRFEEVTMISVDSVNIMSGAEAWDTNLSTTAAAVATNINANTSTPNYIATSVGGVVTIEAVYESGTSPNDFVVSATIKSLTNTPVVFSGGVDEVISTGTVTLTGTSGDITGIKVNSIEVMSGTESFDSDLTTTAAAIAANIQANTSTPDYNSTSAGAVITISALAGTGTGPNTFVVVTTESGGDISGADVDFAGGVAEVLSSGTITFVNEGDIDMISVNGVDVMSGVENWDTNLTTTVAAVKDNIVAETSSPDYNSTASVGELTITAVAGSGTSPNGFVISDDTVRWTSSDQTDMTGGVAYVPFKRLVINRMMVYIEDSGTATTIKYGAATALTNGWSLLYEKNGNEIDLLDGKNIKSNANLGERKFDVVLNAWGAGNINILARWSFYKSGTPIVIKGTDKFIVRTNIENMTALIDHTFLIQGYSDEDNI